MSVRAVVFACSLSFCLIDVFGSQILNDVLLSGNYEYIDLSYPFNNETVYWPDSKNFQFTNKLEKQDPFWYAAYEFSAGEHGGTHLDAPFHFNETGKRVGEIALENLIVPLIIVDVSSKVNGNPNYILYKQDLDYMINYNMGKPCVIIFKFGWSKYYSLGRNKYLGYNEQTKTLNFPGLSGEVAEWITSSYKNVVGFGVDVASVDSGSSLDYPVHKITAAAGIYSLENVNLNQHVPEFGCTALILPMKIATGTGAPTRIVAICPRSSPTKF